MCHGMGHLRQITQEDEEIVIPYLFFYSIHLKKLLLVKHED